MQIELKKPAQIIILLHIVLLFNKRSFIHMYIGDIQFFRNTNYLSTIIILTEYNVYKVLIPYNRCS